MAKNILRFSCIPIMAVALFGCSEDDDKGADKSDIASKDLVAMIQVLQERVDTLDDEVAAQSAANATQDTDVEALLLEIDSLTQQVAALEEDVIASAALAADAADAVAALESTLPSELWMYDRNHVAKFRVLDASGTSILVDLGNGLRTWYTSGNSSEQLEPFSATNFLHYYYAVADCAGPIYAQSINKNVVYTSETTADVAFYWPDSAEGTIRNSGSIRGPALGACVNSDNSPHMMYPFSATIAVDINPYKIDGPVYLKFKE